MIFTDQQFQHILILMNQCQEENIRQIEKWGVQRHSPFEWLAYLTEEVGELSEAISEHYYRGGLLKEVAKEAIQVSTLALKIAEMYMFDKEKANE